MASVPPVGSTPRRELEAGEMSSLPHLFLAPYIALLMLRHRSLTIFTAANPGIASGGVIGESKSESLRHLCAIPRAVAEYIVVRPEDLACSLQAVYSWRRQHRIGYPLVVKPDVGERGVDVAVVATRAQLARHLGRARGPQIVQRFIRGVEYGLYYFRQPGEVAGRLLSIAEVRYPRDDDHRHRADGDQRGGAFRCLRRVHIDRRALRTTQLESRVDLIAKAHPGFYLGRFDVIADSAESLRAGEFAILELNGVTAEPVHVYDPNVGIIDRTRTLMETWRSAFETGATNHRLGAAPMGELELASRLMSRFIDRGELARGVRSWLTSSREGPAPRRRP